MIFLFFLLLLILLDKVRQFGDMVIGWTLIAALELAIELGIFALWLNG